MYPEDRYHHRAALRVRRTFSLHFTDHFTLPVVDGGIGNHFSTAKYEI
jgi:hypothetical protein